MKKCEYCAVESTDERQNCPSCGAPLKKITKTQAQQNNLNKPHNNNPSQNPNNDIVSKRAKTALLLAALGVAFAIFDFSIMFFAYRSAGIVLGVGAIVLGKKELKQNLPTAASAIILGIIAIAVNILRTSALVSLSLG